MILQVIKKQNSQSVLKTNFTVKDLYELHCISDNTVEPVYNGPVYRGHPVYNGHWTTTQKSSLIFTVKLTFIKRSPAYSGRSHPLDFLNPQFHCFLPVTKLGKKSKSQIFYGLFYHVNCVVVQHDDDDERIHFLKKVNQTFYGPFLSCLVHYCYPFCQ